MELQKMSDEDIQGAIIKVAITVNEIDEIARQIHRKNLLPLLRERTCRLLKRDSMEWPWTDDDPTCRQLITEINPQETNP